MGTPAHDVSLCADGKQMVPSAISRTFSPLMFSCSVVKERVCKGSGDWDWGDSSLPCCPARSLPYIHNSRCAVPIPQTVWYHCDPFVINPGVCAGQCIGDERMTWDESTRRDRLPADWPHRRRAVLTRDRHTCHVCGQAGATEVDHIQAGDDHSLINLAAIHANPCHARKSSREGRGAYAAQRHARTRPAEPHPLDSMGRNHT